MSRSTLPRTRREPPPCCGAWAEPAARLPLAHLLAPVDADDAWDECFGLGIRRDAIARTDDRVLAGVVCGDGELQVPVEERQQLFQVPHSAADVVRRIEDVTHAE